MMARGLILSFSAQTAKFTIPNGFIPRLPLPISKISFVSPRHRGRRLRLSVPSPLFFCNCASPAHHTVDMKTYNEAFSNRMAMAGLKPHHRIAMGVSGGPDSMALCVLTAHWKTQGFNVSYGNGEFIEGLLAIIVDHGLRAESQEEANTVSKRLSKMDVRLLIVIGRMVDLNKVTCRKLLVK